MNIFSPLVSWLGFCDGILVWICLCNAVPCAAPSWPGSAPRPPRVRPCRCPVAVQWCGMRCGSCFGRGPSAQCHHSGDPVSRPAVAWRRRAEAARQIPSSPLMIGYEDAARLKVILGRLYASLALPCRSFSHVVSPPPLWPGHPCLWRRSLD